jgi:hypothetical protein
MEKAVKMLDKKEVLLFAATVRSRICRGKPNENLDKDTQTFAKIVDNNVSAFQSYVDMTGMWCVYVLAGVQYCTAFSQPDDGRCRRLKMT